MQLEGILKSENIDIVLLKNTLKKLGLELFRFQDTPNLPELIALFRTLLEDNTVGQSARNRISWQTKLRKYTGTQSGSISRNRIAVKPVNGDNTVVGSHNETQLTPPIRLGIIKFLHPDRSHGYVIPFQDFDALSHRNFMAATGEILEKTEIKTDIIKGALVVYQERNLGGRNSAVNVAALLPVFVNNAGSFNILVENYLHHDLPLSKINAPGFYFATVTPFANFRQFLLTPQLECDMEKIAESGIKLLARYLQDIMLHKTDISLLNELLFPVLEQAKLDGVYITWIRDLSGKPINELTRTILDIKELAIPGHVITPLLKTFNKLSFAYWLNDILPQLPDIVTPDQYNIWKEIVKTIGREELMSVLLRLVPQLGDVPLTRMAYEELLQTPWVVHTESEKKAVLEYVALFKTTFSDLKLSESHFISEQSSFYISLWERGIISTLSEKIIIHHIDNLSSGEEKAAFIERLTEDEIHHFYGIYSGLSDYYEKYYYGIFKQILDTVACIGLDLESDGKIIKEVAWVTQSNKHSYHDYNNIKDAVIALVSELSITQSLVVGHNIKAFDLPILADAGAKVAEDQVWDTYEIEMLLHPQRHSYGLRTVHEALADALLGKSLFLNQLLRILTLQADEEIIISLLPAKGALLVKTLRMQASWNRIKDFKNDFTGNEYFRPAAPAQYLSESNYNLLKNTLPQTGNTILIAPAILHFSLASCFNVHFLSAGAEWMYLSEDKIWSCEEIDNLLKSVLIRYARQRITNGLLPYYKLLPTAIRIKVGNDRALLLCDVQGYDQILGEKICIEPQQLELVKHFVDDNPGITIMVIGQELYDLSTKKQLGQDYDFATIYSKLKREATWLQLSGGMSFVGMDKRQCSLLGISSFPDYLRYIWLEKSTQGKFRVWCNCDVNAQLETLSRGAIMHVQWTNEKAHKSNAYILTADTRAGGYIAEQRRVNPESAYRQIYWVYQFRIMEALTAKDLHKGIVLLLNDASELQKLRDFARSLGYYIPDAQASLSRQLELLHSSRSKRKLIIMLLNDLPTILAANYLGALNFIWDSFLIQEKHQMLRTISGDELNYIEDDLESEFHPDVPATKKGVDLFSIIILHKPLLDLYYKMIQHNDAASSLFLLDPRLGDYHAIEKNFGVNALKINMWSNEDEYVSEMTAADSFFPSDPGTRIADFNVEEAKEILRHIFLMPEDGNVPFEWYDYQHPCLNDILPAKKDLLVSLPTGAGKSLLFQGPALFRAAFTSRMTIVITPLRALMQDHVDFLWNKGFYSNVEFISGDKSKEEVKDIYRRIAGGEIALLYITPERFRSRPFENSLLTRLSVDKGLEYAVFDEAHCISQWGQEFRPDYLNAARKIADLCNHFTVRKLLFSATISDQVFEEIEHLMPGIGFVDGTDKSYNPVRDHIKIGFKGITQEQERLDEVAKYLKEGAFDPTLSRAIIFVRMRKQAEELAELMPDTLKAILGATCDYANKVGFFHAGMDGEDRRETYDQFKTGELVILFATKAFGMGMDIPNIHFVTHFTPPGTFEDFLQEIGRAGRNEKQRKAAGFDNQEKPIKTICITATNDFARLKDQLHKSAVSWNDIKDVKRLTEAYVGNFRLLQPDDEKPIAVPFNLYSGATGNSKDDVDTRFRLALHWLERLKRIRLGYFTVTHLAFSIHTLASLPDMLVGLPDANVVKICKAVLELTAKQELQGTQVLLSIASLKTLSQLGQDSMFTALLSAHRAGLLCMKEEIKIIPTKLRKEETDFAYKIPGDAHNFPALKTLFAYTAKIMGDVPFNGSRIFEGEDLDYLLNEALEEIGMPEKLPWSNKDQQDSIQKEREKYLKDIQKKRGKHAFSIIRLLGKTRHESIIEKQIDSSRKLYVRQSVFNGFSKREEWANKLYQMETDCIKILLEIGKQHFEQNISKYNWADLITKLHIRENVQYLSDLFFILSITGYVLSESLLPTGIEVYITSLDEIKEQDLQSEDKIIHDEFELTKKIRELKLIALQVMRGIERDRYDAFIKGYFACNSLESLLALLEAELPANDPILNKWRGDAIKEQEERLNIDQRKVYDAEVNQHINVMAGPGSGKTHTLTLRVARLIHHINVIPEEILVLAYNRAVVSELKERLGKLMSDLGYGSMIKRLKIFTFHGLAKKFYREETEGKPFSEWEPLLLERLKRSPGTIMSRIGSLKHILVDEFQDINDIRLDLLQTLQQFSNSSLFIIGDPNQSIYGYERTRSGGDMGPWSYYDRFKEMFAPANFELYDNHRSYPAILEIASKILALPEAHSHLIPKATKLPDAAFMKEYVTIVDRTIDKREWWNTIAGALEERLNGRPYKQIAILFRTNNEVYRGLQQLQKLNIPNVRIRIQGNLPYEFTRLREFHSIMLLWQEKIHEEIPQDFALQIRDAISLLTGRYPDWNHFYLRIMHALVLEFLEEMEGNARFEHLLEFIQELTYRDDGQLYKLYEKHSRTVTEENSEMEIVLTTMHKVKGLEFDAVIVPPSFANLPLIQGEDMTDEEIKQHLAEEKRLLYVAFTRARYRLFVFRYNREMALENDISYKISDVENQQMGKLIQPGLDKLKLNWAAKSYNFNGLYEYINDHVKSGIPLIIKKKHIQSQGQDFYTYQVWMKDGQRPVGELSTKTDLPGKFDTYSGYIVHEVAVWSFEETCRHDNENGTNYAANWCPEAIERGYIYLVDFSGYGTGQIPDVR